jgi:hypothetical protein
MHKALDSIPSTRRKKEKREGGEGKKEKGRKSGAKKTVSVTKTVILN